jgi:A/G-specific adenine glycosylase
VGIYACNIFYVIHRDNIYVNVLIETRSLNLSREEIEDFRRKIIYWYRVHGDRDLPWRKRRGEWEVFVAVTLLRSTRRELVARVYGEFLENYSDPRRLASSKLEDVRKLIKPLGLYNERSRELIEAARIIVSVYNGRIPCDREKLLELPGVGDYAASVILLRACGKPEPLLDRNTVKVYGRVFGVKPSKFNPYRDPVIRDLAVKLVPMDPEEAYEFNLGIMDLASKVCVDIPRCNICPIKEHCKWFKRKPPETLF